MNLEEIITKLQDLEHPDYGHIYIEFGGSKDYRVVSYCKEGFWYYNDAAHGDRNYRCDSLQEALQCLVIQPQEWEWSENLNTQREEGVI